MFLPDCVWAFCYGSNSKMRPRGTKSEAAAVIMNWGTQKESSNIGFIGPCPRGGIICEDFAILDAGRQREENKKEKTQFILFSHPYKTPSGSKKKEENKRVGAKNTERFGALAQRFTWFGDLHENID